MLLISKGADVDACDNDGRTALSYACELGRNDVIDILLKSSVDPNIADFKGSTKYRADNYRFLSCKPPRVA